METHDTKTYRLFFALWPDDSVRGELAKLTKKHLPELGKHVHPENLHITLAFVGSVDGETRDCMEQAAQEVRASPLTLVFDHLGHFPRPRVVWAGCSVFPESLKQLVTDLNQALIPCGYKPETRPFVPHLTLARKVKSYTGERDIKPVEWSIDRFCLVESHTLPEGVQYQVIREWPLK